MNIILFAGQGAQYSGMGKDIFENYPSAQAILKTGSEILGYDLEKVCFDENFTELSRTLYAQPAIMAMELMCFEAAKEKGLVFEAVAGHSLGEYAALVASGMVSLEDGFRIIKARAEAFDRVASSADGKMAAILKLTADQVREVCESVDGYVVPVNYNSPAQTVIAGETAAVEAACEKFSAMKARVAPLNTESAFHSEIMKPASEEFYEKIKDIKFNAPSVKFFSNLTGSELTDFSDMPSLLAKHVVSPVRFTDELAAVKEAGFDRYIELGPGKTLTGLVKKTLTDITAFNIDSAEALEKAEF
ncbi:MAG: ACP S-malonyltransferase [Oscillospiraceae bacterium]|nr:ACP S-malonyltransferase [Oscillospiraceae bacterium]